MNAARYPVWASLARDYLAIRRLGPTSGRARYRDGRALPPPLHDRVKYYIALAIAAALRKLSEMFNQVILDIL